MLGVKGVVWFWYSTLGPRTLVLREFPLYGRRLQRECEAHADRDKKNFLA